MNYFTDDLPNAQYHLPKSGIGSSNIKTLLEGADQFAWSQAAPQDRSKMPAIDFGEHFHTYFLEPERFKESYQVLDKVNRRTNDGKAHEQAQIAHFKQNNITPVKAEDMEKLEAMRVSAMAHPVIAKLMSMNGVAERSYFWTDEKTGVRCKCRPDWFVEIDDSNRFEFMSEKHDCLILDIKTIGQIDQLEKQIENLKYFVQDAHYCNGIKTVTGLEPYFLFAFVSTTMQMGRYPVHVVQLSSEARMDGMDRCHEALELYADIKANESDSSWMTVEVMDRPYWATRDEGLM